MDEAEATVAGESNAARRVTHLAREGDWAALHALLASLNEADRAHAAAHLQPDQLTHLLESEVAGSAAALLDLLPVSQAAMAIGEVAPEHAADILEELPSDDRADLLAQMNAEDMQAILAETEPDTAAETIELLSHAPDTAGGLMVKEYFAVTESARASEVIDEIRSHPSFRDYQIQYIYVTSDTGHLVGVLRIRSLLVSRPDEIVATLTIHNPLTVDVGAGIEALSDLFEANNFLGVPVVDHDGRLVGVVHRSDLEQATVEQAQADHMKSLGIASGEELRSMPMLLRSRRRLSWLSINIVLNILAASVIAAYEDTLRSVIALAVFLPMISDMSGCSGNQAVAVSLRELSLGVLRPNELARVLAKEAAVGVVNGITLGVLIGIVASAWKGNAALGLVVGGALAVNTLVAVSIGGTIPLLIRRFGQDPALASGPVLTTVTDVCGFFFALSFATLALSHLT